jgi:hypothetical protein
VSFVTEQLRDSVMPSSKLTHAGPTAQSVVFPGREDQDPRPAQLIDKAVNLAVPAALGDANRLFRRPPFRRKQRDTRPKPMATSSLNPKQSRHPKPKS